MHLPRFFQDGKFCSPWKKAAFHKFWQHCLEELQCTTVGATSQCAKLNTVRNIPNDVERNKDV